MKNLLAFLAAAVLVFAGVGWYFNWFQINTSAAAAGHHAFSIDLNGDKMSSDVKQGAEKVVDAVEKARLEAEVRKAEADKKTAAAKGNTTDPKNPDWSKSEK